MITDKEFTEAISKFDELEKRGSSYDMAVGLVNSSFEIEAPCLFLTSRPVFLLLTCPVG